MVRACCIRVCVPVTSILDLYYSVPINRNVSIFHSLLKLSLLVIILSSLISQYHRSTVDNIQWIIEKILSILWHLIISVSYNSVEPKKWVSMFYLQIHFSWLRPRFGGWTETHYGLYVLHIRKSDSVSFCFANCKTKDWNGKIKWYSVKQSFTCFFFH